MRLNDLKKIIKNTKDNPNIVVHVECYKPSSDYQKIKTFTMCMPVNDEVQDECMNPLNGGEFIFSINIIDPREYELSEDEKNKLEKQKEWIKIGKDNDWM